MKHGMVFGIAFLIFAAFGLALSQAQDPNQDEQVRGAFLTTRVGGSVSLNTNTKPTNSSRASNTEVVRNSNSTRVANRNAARNRNQAQSANTSRQNTNGGTAAYAGNANSGGLPGTGGAFKGVSATAIGLGFSVYLRASNGEALRVDPVTVFHSGDRIRVLLETNTDGFLYIFHSENDAAPTMIFPDSRLKGGDNKILAHVPYDVPSNAETDERFRWFVFDEVAATEKLYVVITRAPLPGVMIAQDLQEFCRANQSKCPWRPAPEIWTQVLKVLNDPVALASAVSFGQAMTNTERDAATRGLGLDKSAPPPSVVRMNLLPASGIHITTISLAHR